MTPLFGIDVEWSINHQFKPPTSQHLLPTSITALLWSNILNYIYFYYSNYTHAISGFEIIKNFEVLQITPWSVSNLLINAHPVLFSLHPPQAFSKNRCLRGFGLSKICLRSDCVNRLKKLPTPQSHPRTWHNSQWTWQCPINSFFLLNHYWSWIKLIFCFRHLSEVNNRFQRNHYDLCELGSFSDFIHSPFRK